MKVKKEKLELEGKLRESRDFVGIIQREILYFYRFRN